ncbi:hypothetical protein FOA52_014373 [Chlamydomonas sp. UWO 241]|nr:hypothetical protein FOA52_014373 [Chlamydomonas sp. UWO 241]
MGSTSLNEWLRNTVHVKSTKLACGEGGCGACAVLVSTTDAQTGAPTWRSVNSCLMPLFSAHGKSIVTAEGLPLTQRSDEESPGITERLAGFHASQCGFCTPGMAVACASALAKAKARGGGGGGGDGSCQPTKAQMHAALDGNLCRCTGYRPIIDAATSFACDVDIEELGLHALARCGPMPPSGGGGVPPVPPALCGDAAPGEEARTHNLGRGRMLHVPTSTAKLTRCLGELSRSGADVRMVAGNTGPGVFKDWPHDVPHLVSLSDVAELSVVEADGGDLRIGSGVTLSVLADSLEKEAAGSSAWLAPMAAHMRRVAGSHVRNAATVGGNLVLARTHGLPSDVATLLMAAGARVSIIDCRSTRPTTLDVDIDDLINLRSSPDDVVLFGLGSAASLVVGVRVPLGQQGETLFWSQRIAKRWANAHCLANVALRLTVRGGKVVAASMAVGMDLGRAKALEPSDWMVVRPTCVEDALVGMPVGAPSSADVARVLGALAADLSSALAPAAAPRADYLRSATEGLLFQAVCELLGAPSGSSATGSGASRLPPPCVPRASQDFPDPDPKEAPLTAAVPKTGVQLQARGTAPYADDTPHHPGCLFAAPVLSTRAAGKLLSVDAAPALAVPGVAVFLSAGDVPGANRAQQLLSDAAASAPKDGPLFADGCVEFAGQMIGIILADSYQTAVRAAKLVKIEYGDPASPPLLSIDDAIAASSYHAVAPIFSFNPSVEPSVEGGGTGIMVRTKGVDIAAAIAAAPKCVRGGTYSFPSQYHFYMEPQTTRTPWEAPDPGFKNVHGL